MKKAAIIFSSLGLFLFLASPAFASDNYFTCGNGYIVSNYTFTGNESGTSAAPGDTGIQITCYHLLVNGVDPDQEQLFRLHEYWNSYSGSPQYDPNISEDETDFLNSETALQADGQTDIDTTPSDFTFWIDESANGLTLSGYTTVGLCAAQGENYCTDYTNPERPSNDTILLWIQKMDLTPGSYDITTNNPPQINSLNGGTINEGSAYTENGSFTDADSASWTATVDYGDGSGSQPLILNSDKTFPLSHVYQDNGTYTVTVNVTDNQGAIGTATATVTVNNAAPSVGSVTPLTATINNATSFTGNFTDPGVLDTHSAQWDWGDGNTLTGTITENNGSGSVTNAHTYTALGSYTITLTATDNDGASGNSQNVISVIPTTGLANGNLSHANYSGADLSNQNISKANFSVGTFNNVDFSSANFSQVNGSNSSFTNDNFTSANLNKVNLSNSNLSGSNFTNAIVTQGNLSNANLTNVDFTGANLQGANLSGTTKTGIIWSNTTCPNGQNSDNHNNSCTGQGGGL